MIHSVLAHLSKWLLVLTLTFSLGVHWMLVQSVAWAGMIVSYSQQSSFAEALGKTFDGKHPCCLCKLVQQGKASEKKQGMQKPETKLDKQLPACAAISPFTPGFYLVTFYTTVLPGSLFESPPKLPPRGFLA